MHTFKVLLAILMIGQSAKGSDVQLYQVNDMLANSCEQVGNAVARAVQENGLPVCTLIASCCMNSFSNWFVPRTQCVIKGLSDLIGFRFDYAQNVSIDRACDEGVPNNQQTRGESHNGANGQEAFLVTEDTKEGKVAHWVTKSGKRVYPRVKFTQGK